MKRLVLYSYTARVGMFVAVVKHLESDFSSGMCYISQKATMPSLKSLVTFINNVAYYVIIMPLVHHIWCGCFDIAVNRRYFSNVHTI